MRPGQRLVAVTGPHNRDHRSDLRHWGNPIWGMHVSGGRTRRPGRSTYAAVMTPEMILEAFGAESQRLSEIVAGADDATFTRPSPCVPWTVAELVYHVRMTMGRLSGMLAAPEPTGTGLVSAVGYYRADQRFSAAANADRIQSAQRGAAALPGAAARARDFAAARQQAWTLLQVTPPGRVVQTRHGDRMLLTEFLRTRVLELAVHGLDLATALERQPWTTGPGRGSHRTTPAAFRSRRQAKGGDRLGPGNHDRQARRPLPGNTRRDPAHRVPPHPTTRPQLRSLAARWEPVAAAIRRPDRGGMPGLEVVPMGRGGIVKTCGSACHALLLARCVADHGDLPPSWPW